MSELKVAQYDFPACCPGAKIRHVYDHTRPILNGERAGAGYRRTVQYECANCGKVLKPLIGCRAPATGYSPA